MVRPGTADTGFGVVQSAGCRLRALASGVIQTRAGAPLERRLAEIHEQIDREYPGQVDLTELFDFPTIAELARHLQSKLA